jgi:ubiquinone/menaquinone biosynthesis C-methylase UbiE
LRFVIDNHQWDKLASQFEIEVCDIAREETGKQISGLMRHVVRVGAPKVLVDLGCGVGSFVRLNHQHFERVIAVDFSRAILNRAKVRCARVKNVEWHQLDVAAAWHSLKNRADLVSCFNVVTSPDDAVCHAIWTSISRIVKKGGHALVGLPSLESERMVANVTGEPGKRSADDRLVERDGVVQRFYRRPDLTPLFAKYGFALTKIRRAYYPWRKEGLRKPRGAKSNPWDWICLAQKTR